MLCFPNVLKIRGQKPQSDAGGKRKFITHTKSVIPTPLFTEESLTGTMQRDVFSKILSDRKIMLFDQIDDHAACVVVAQLMFLESVDPGRDITLYINSSGGVVSSGLAIYDAMRHLRCDVSTICIGKAASMGAFLLSAGTKGKRYSMENSSIMIHQALGGAPFGQATDVQIQAEHLIFTKKTLDRLLAGTTGRSVEEIARDTERDFYMTPEEAVKYGMIDEVIRDE